MEFWFNANAGRVGVDSNFKFWIRYLVCFNGRRGSVNVTRRCPTEAATPLEISRVGMFVSVENYSMDFMQGRFTRVANFMFFNRIVFQGVVSRALQL